MRKTNSIGSTSTASRNRPRAHLAMPHQGQNFFHLHLSILWICVLTRVHTHAHTRTHTRTHTSARAHTHTTHTVAIENMQTCRRWWGAPLSLPPSSTRQTFDMSRIRYQGTDLSELKKKVNLYQNGTRALTHQEKKIQYQGSIQPCASPHLPRLSSVCVCVCVCVVCVCACIAHPLIYLDFPRCVCVCVCVKKKRN